MRAGKLDRLVTVQTYTTIDDGVGNHIPTWTDKCSLRAQKIEASTEEFIRGYGTSTETVIVFRTRWAENITPDLRLIYEGQPYEIIELKEIGRRRGLEFRVKRMA